MHRKAILASLTCSMSLVASPCLGAMIVASEDAGSIPAAPGGVFVWGNPDGSTNTDNGESLAQTFQVDAAFTGFELRLGYDRYRANSGKTNVDIGVAIYKVADTLAETLVLGDEIFSDVINLSVAESGGWSADDNAARFMELQFDPQNRPSFDASTGDEGYALVITWEDARAFVWSRAINEYDLGRSYKGTEASVTGGGASRDFAMAIYIPEPGSLGLLGLGGLLLMSRRLRRA